jgi:hypothetical protein
MKRVLLNTPIPLAMALSYTSISSIAWTKGISASAQETEYS